MAKIQVFALFGALFGCHIYTKDPQTIQMFPKGAHRVCAPSCNSLVWPQYLWWVLGRLEGSNEGEKGPKCPFLPIFGVLFSWHIYKKDPQTMQVLPKGAHTVCAPYHNSLVWSHHLWLVLGRPKAFKTGENGPKCPFCHLLEQL
jgi:hypothetical protein